MFITLYGNGSSCKLAQAPAGETNVIFGNTNSAVFYGRSQDGITYLYSKNGIYVKPQVFTLSEITKLYGTTTNMFGTSVNLEPKYHNYKR